WRQRAEVIARRSPWRTVEDLLAYLGVRWRNVWERRWRQIPHVRRHHSLGGTNHPLGTPLIHQDAFPTIRQSLDLSRFRCSDVRPGRVRLFSPSLDASECPVAFAVPAHGADCLMRSVGLGALGIAGVNTRPLQAATVGIAGNWGSTLRPHPRHRPGAGV